MQEKVGQGPKADGAGTGSAEKSPKKHSIEEVIDAVSGATWNTRNRIMEDLFKEELAASDGGMPTFAPPGSSIENERGK